MKLKRYEANPIVIPGEPEWRAVTTFNPGVVLDDDGVFWMLERACWSLDPLYCCFGLLRSEDGYHFDLVGEEPVFTAEQRGTPRGTVEDARLVKYDEWYYMTYVHRILSASCHPNGTGIPKYTAPEGMTDDPNHYRSGIARSRDLITWEDLGLVTPREVDDRDCVLFPEKVNGRYAMVRRPMHYVGPEYGCDRPSVWISTSDDLLTWDEPRLVAQPENVAWEATKIGASGQPIPTDRGWLFLYHGVDKKAVYRTGVMLLDKDDPTRVIARAPDFIMEPEEYYEKVGLIIPRVVFPSASVVKDDTLFTYYGCCDTCISVATCPVDEILDYVCGYPR